jgi:hypothetical protein
MQALSNVKFALILCKRINFYLFTSLSHVVGVEGPRHRWDDNIKMDLQDVGWGMDWIELAHDRDR